MNPITDLVQVVDVYGSPHYVSEKDLEESKRKQVRLYNANGMRLEGEGLILTIHRDNISNVLLIN
ncbi:MAG: hypothetical protein ACJAS1_001628 [Oleiphilaceae bacterium]|jgi:hypothetical protein